MIKHPEKQYLDGSYAANNPEWDGADSEWKASRVCDILPKVPMSICEVGCGGGGVLAAIRKQWPECALTGFDVSPQARDFWQRHESLGIDFHVGDFLVTERKYETILLLDVLEHVTDPHGFLLAIRKRAEQFVFHFPLDLSASSVLRESPLLYVRRRVGHIHYFTKGLALELLHECGFEVLDCRYTGAAFNTPQADLHTRLAQLPRRLAYVVNKDVGVRLLGGETLMVLARPKT